MRVTFQQAWGDAREFSGSPKFSSETSIPFSAFRSALLAALLLIGGGATHAQVNVLTQHNDNARTGQNLNETILTPSNVNPNQFGKLFSQSTDGGILAQPLYVSRVAIPNNGTHNVVYVATVEDQVYAFDADTNGGSNANPLWQTNLLTDTTPAGTFTVGYGVLGTPVIDLTSKAIYLVTSENEGATPVFRFHALDITTGAEKFGGPILIQGSVPGTGSGSVGVVLTFDATYQQQRAGLLFLNGVVYVAFGSVGDEGPWHGWIFSFDVNPTTKNLQLIDVFCTTPNGSGGGIWMGAAGLAAEVNNPAKPYGRMFFATANGSFSSTAPYSYSMSMLDLDLTDGVMTVEDQFTPYNWATLNAEDGDLGSGGPVLLPTQTLASGKTLNPLVEIGKSGMFYILDRDNNTDGSNNPASEYSPAGLGGSNTAADQVVQEVQTPLSPGFDWGAGVWGTEAYWNNNIYSGGTNLANDSNYTGTGNSLTAYSFVNGVLSVAPTSQSVEQYYYPGPTPGVSANGATNGIVWALMCYQEGTGGPETLLAYDATDLGNTLYSSATNLSRDNPGAALKYVVPTITNGKVYVGASNQLSVYGLLNSVPTAPAPTMTPGTETFVSPPWITITDSAANATIYYTTDGSMPTTSSAVYQAPIPVSANETLTAIASVPGELMSPPTVAIYLSSTVPANPALSLAPGTYTGTQTLTITDSTPGAAIYYTIDGPAPTAASAVYNPSQPLSVSTSQTVQAVAIAGAYSSSVVSSTYTIQPVGTIDFSQGFALADGPMQF